MKLSRDLTVDWTAPRLLCIAGDFTRYDEHAVLQIDRSIELIRYRQYGSELLLFALVNSTTSGEAPRGDTTRASRSTTQRPLLTISLSPQKFFWPVPDWPWVTTSPNAN